MTNRWIRLGVALYSTRLMEGRRSEVAANKSVHHLEGWASHVTPFLLALTVEPVTSRLQLPVRHLLSRSVQQGRLVGDDSRLSFFVFFLLLDSLHRDTSWRADWRRVFWAEARCTASCIPLPYEVVGHKLALPFDCDQTSLFERVAKRLEDFTCLSSDL